MYVSHRSYSMVMVFLNERTATQIANKRKPDIACFSHRHCSSIQQRRVIAPTIYITLLLVIAMYFLPCVHPSLGHCVVLQVGNKELQWPCAFFQLSATWEVLQASLCVQGAHLGQRWWPSQSKPRTSSKPRASQEEAESSQLPRRGREEAKEPGGRVM